MNFITISRRGEGLLTCYLASRGWVRNVSKETANACLLRYSLMQQNLIPQHHREK